MNLITKLWRWLLQLWRGRHQDPKPSEPKHEYRTIPLTDHQWGPLPYCGPDVYGEWLIITGRYWRNLKKRKLLKP